MALNQPLTRAGRLPQEYLHRQQLLRNLHHVRRHRAQPGPFGRVFLHRAALPLARPFRRTGPLLVPVRAAVRVAIVPLLLPPALNVIVLGRRNQTRKSGLINQVAGCVWTSGGNSESDPIPTSCSESITESIPEMTSESESKLTPEFELSPE